MCDRKVSASTCIISRKIDVKKSAEQSLIPLFVGCYEKMRSWDDKLSELRITILHAAFVVVVVVVM